ncbi:T9SS type A sorting domain-containing protein [Taibaiella soli]|uniref:Secretion system C-terminal sorting domain-containing protein n=1 Tax=Taibaiella soli TaxID=1649169 RepID=A0A2W2AEZ8_9BACT|nr:T9SS type A sorting domain-containing protein [Taibaiella soli]PZF74055.1 hypothetical protein DN068_05010 [Taibaiella soli]
MNRFRLLLLSLLLAGNYCDAQTAGPGIHFSKTYGGSHDDIGEQLIQTRDKGFLIAGYTNSTDDDIAVPGSDTTANQYDIFLVKTDSIGSVQWTKVLNNAGTEALRKIVETDSSYVVAGETFTNVNHDFANIPAISGFLFWIDKTNGSIINAKGYKQPALSTSIFDMVLAKDGNIVCTGYYNGLANAATGVKGGGDVWIMKVQNNTGNVIWQKFWGGTNTEQGYGIVSDSTGGYTIVGTVASTDGDAPAPSYGQGDAFVLNVDSMGNTRWYKKYGTSGSQYLAYIGKTASGYIVGGYANVDGTHVHGTTGNGDYWVMKLNNAGDTVWTRTFGGSEFERLVSLAVTNDGGVFINGYVTSTDGTFAQPGAMVDNGLLRLDSNGNVVWKKRMGSNLADNVGAGIVTCDNGYAFTALASQMSGDVTGTNHGNFEMWLCKLNSDGLDNITPDAPCNYKAPTPQPSGVAQLSAGEPVIIFPNPTTGIFQLKNVSAGSTIKLLNQVGQIVYQQTATKKTEQINPGALAAGLYIIQITTPDKTTSNFKLLIQ